MENKAAARAAKAAGWSRPTFQKAAEMVHAAERDERFAPFVSEMDKRNKVNGVYKKFKAEQERHADAKEKRKLPASVAKRFRLQVSPIEELSIPPGEVDVVITDPPYPREYLPLFSDLSRLCAECLPPGGSAFVMCGQSYLAEAMARLSERLTYNWTLAYLTPGGQSAQLWQRKVNTFWKPVLWYVNGEYRGDWFGDVVKSDVNDNEKAHHHWGQSVSGMADLVMKCSRVGQAILDPFCGGGSCALAALANNRRFIGADIDQKCIETTNERIRESLGHNPGAKS